MRPTRTAIATAAAALAAAGAATALAAQPAGAAGCSTPWGSAAETSDPGTAAPLTALRAGRHACFDRLVVDLAGPAGGYDVRYVSQVTRDGSGTPVPLRGAADLQVVVRAPAYDEQGRATYAPARPSEAVRVAGFTTFRQVAWAGSFEGQSTVGLGVRARLPFRVMTVTRPTGGSSVVVDVAHRW